MARMKKMSGSDGPNFRDPVYPVDPVKRSGFVERPSSASNSSILRCAAAPLREYSGPVRNKPRAPQSTAQLLA
jgi:hypothetical protein